MRYRLPNAVYLKGKSEYWVSQTVDVMQLCALSLSLSTLVIKQKVNALVNVYMLVKSFFIFLSNFACDTAMYLVMATAVSVCSRAR
jgi:hypothetical protein